jgi:hypothetical protein
VALDPTYTVCHADAGRWRASWNSGRNACRYPSHWLQYIGTRDVDGTADAAVRAGRFGDEGAIDMQGADATPCSRIPQGAVFAIIDPENARPGSAGRRHSATFSWHELGTTDNEAPSRSTARCSAGTRMQRMDMGPAGST